MAKIIEYLAIDRNYIFAVDVSTASANTNTGVAGFRNPNGKFTFGKGDSFILLSYGIMLPENFTFFERVGAGLPSLNLTGIELSTGKVFALPCFKASNPANTLQRVIEENKEHEISGYCNYNDLGISGNFGILGGFVNPLIVSMLNVPAAADTKSYYAVPFVKVAHNLPLI
jgi:hypothetical protein